MKAYKELGCQEEERMERYHAQSDPYFSKPYIDEEADRVRQLGDGQEVAFHYVHGGFEGTDVKFSFCFPEKERYEGRFYQYLSPFPGPEEEKASLPVTGPDDKIGFCLTHGAYYVETNMGSKAIFTNSDVPQMTAHSSAAAAEFSRQKAAELYGYAHRPYGYVYGGSGGAYRTIACIENTDTYDGAVPYVVGSPYAIPNCQTTRAYAERILRNKIPQIIDAVDAGGSGDPYAGLNEEEAAALREATLFGYPLKSWFSSADLNDGALPVLAPGIKQMDPEYFEDYWKVPGYLGADPNGNAARARICREVEIKAVFTPEGELLEKDPGEKAIDTRNGVDNAWKKMIREGCSTDAQPWLELSWLPEGEHPYLKGLTAEFITGEAAGMTIDVDRIEDGRMYFKEGFMRSSVSEALKLAKPGDTVKLDNSDYIAVQTYHRHQVPTPDYKAWDQFRDAQGKPLYPQQKMLLGPGFCGNGPGCEQNGQVEAKVIIVAALMDEQAYPWQADWYRRKIASVKGGDDSEYIRLWYFDNVLHGDTTESANELRVTTYLAGLDQALVDLADWVEKGKTPLPSTHYQADGGHVIVPERARERGGLQAVPVLTANGSKCAHVKAGEPVIFEVTAEVPKGAGKLTSVAWSLDGDSTFARAGEWELSEDGRRGKAAASYTYDQPGTYFGVVRVTSERTGDKAQLFTQIRNIDRVRVVVE